MRIALVLPSLTDPAHQTVAKALGQEFTKLGNEIFVFAEDNASYCHSRESGNLDPSPKVVIGDLAPRLRHSGATRIVDSGMTRKLEELLHEKQIDVCHIQYFCRGLKYMEQVRFPERTSLILTYQGASIEFIDHPEVFQQLAQKADCVTSVSQQGLEELKSWIPSIRSKSCVVHNGVDLAPAVLSPSLVILNEVKDLRPIVIPAKAGIHGSPTHFRRRTTSSSRKVLRALGASVKAFGDDRTRDPFILSVGRLAAYKGMDLLSVAFGNLLSEGHDLHLIICGPDQTEGQLDRFINQLGLTDRIHLLGNVDHSDVQYLLHESLFFVLPSRRENFPMALLEAMAAGKAVIASHVGGIPEMIEHEENGLLVEPKDPENLFSAMKRLVKEPLLRERLGQKARETVAARFSWTSIAKQYLEIYAVTKVSNVSESVPKLKKDSQRNFHFPLLT